MSRPKPPGCVFCPTSSSRVPGIAIRRPVWGKVKTPVSLYGSDAGPAGVVYGVFEPLNPVVPGHLLVVPSRHSTHAAEDSALAAGAMDVAATVAARYRSFNIITSAGAPATQTVPHLHLHVVPRHAGDGLTLPWSTP